MELSNKNIQHIKELFSELKTTDPKIIITDNSIELIPFYWNYSFVTSFIPLLVAGYIFNYQNDLEVNLLCMATMAISIFNIVNQLTSYNRLIINLTNNTISIIPNFIVKIWENKKIIEFRSIKNIDSTSDSLSLLYRRFVIKLRLKNYQSLKLISAQEKNNADKISEILLNLF